MTDTTFWYDTPAAAWHDGLPLGNGRMGAMVFGGARAEQLSLSETTFWSGAPSPDHNSEDGAAIFPQARQALLNGDLEGAERLTRKMLGRKLNFGTNLPFGNLRLTFRQMETAERDYRRELDLDRAVATVRCQVNGVTFTRETFVSAPHQARVMRLASRPPAGRCVRAALDGDEQPHTAWSTGSDGLCMRVQALETLHSDGTCGVTGFALLRVLPNGGRVLALENCIDVQGADSALLLLTLATNFGGADPACLCTERMAAAAALPYETLLQAHLEEHRGWFRRCSLDLGETLHPDWPLDRRIAAARAGEVDAQLYALLFQYGRYLLIGSSRPDSPLPAHLNGVWNDNKACRIEWTCDYHLDINTQMNYWIAERTNLSECHQPLFAWIEHTLVPSGRETARKVYGLPGWVAHIFSNPWGFTSMGWDTFWGVFPTGGVWVAMHLWDHYSFTGDRSFLARQAYPILKEAAQFCLSYLSEDPVSGWLVSGPANSPENAFRVDGKTYSVALAPTVDRVLMDALFSACMDAVGDLQSAGLFPEEAAAREAAFAAQLRQARAKLPPFQVGSHGQLQEWLEDYEEAMPGHRHTSHLLSVYPFAQISAEDSRLANAAKVTIQRRVSAPDYEEGTWARNNITAIYARLHDSAAAWDSLSTLFRKEAGSSLMIGTRLAPADAYEMDYNTGATAGIAEMLLQSPSGALDFLPALPAVWPQGAVQGLCARGGFTVDLAWQGGQLQRAVIHARLGGPCRVRCTGNAQVECQGAPVPLQRIDAQTVEFLTQPGAVYHFIMG
jgi:alpha-L-fucosidase 2